MKQKEHEWFISLGIYSTVVTLNINDRWGIRLRKFAARCHHAEEFCIIDDSVIVLVRLVCLFPHRKDDI
jgi:hypothetical protein